MITPGKNVRINSNRDSDSSLDEVKEGPNGVPKGNKNFKKILDNGEQDGGKRQSILSEEEEDGAMMGSIFEISKKKSNEKMKDVQEQPQLNLNALAAASSQIQHENEESEEELDDVLSKRQKATPQEFTEESTDLSGVRSFNPTLENVANSPSVFDENVKPNTTLTDLVNQIVKNMSVLQSGDVTTTTFSLKNLPQLENVDVTLTAYKTAPREFNLTISNLTDAGKTLLDMNLGSLKQVLDQRGIVIHMITTTTVELPQTNQTAQGENFNRNGREEQQGGQGRGKQPKEEK